MRALIDGDVLRYEVGFGAEAAFRGTPNEYAPDCVQWTSVERLLHTKLEQIVYEAGADSYTLYLTKGKSFRHDIATTKPYKGTRIENKPFHWKNLTAYMIGVLGAEVVENGLEADDAMAMQSIASPGECIICSRDKDLRQVPGHFYSWELHLQPSFGPCLISPEGSLELNTEGKTPRLTGTGFSWFAAQCLMGDKTDNIPGLPGWGPVKTYEELKMCNTPEEVAGMLETLFTEEEYLLEQGRLCWLVRRMKPNGEPELWELGMTE